MHIVETISFSENQYRLKVGAYLATSMALELRLYVNGAHLDYSYQLIENQEPILRWDNKEHFSEINSYLHHFHAEAGQVQASPLNGATTHDLPLVIQYLAERLKK